jgi:hypothetical protein
MPDKDDDQFLSPLAQGAMMMFELFSEYVKAGFTRQEALQLTLESLRASDGGESG